MKRAARGFTLVEIMVTVAILGILTAIALPSYRDYVVRARLTEAFSGLSAAQPVAEQLWSNTRSFETLGTVPTRVPTRILPADTPTFAFTASNLTASTYTVTATGAAQALGFVFTIDQQGNRATTGVPTGWTTNDSCWVDRRGGSCSQ